MATNVRLDKITLIRKDEHLVLISKNKNSYIRENDLSWRIKLNSDSYQEWLGEFNKNGSMGIFIDDKLIGEVLFYNKDNKSYFGIWVDVDLVGQGIGSAAISSITIPKNTYVEFLLSNQRVINILNKNGIKFSESGFMGVAKIS